MVQCHQCSKLNETGERVGRRDSCSECDADLHVCLNCLHYDPAAYNECHEPQADRVLEKNRANFCDYFSPLSDRENKGLNQKDKVKNQLEDLFKKKS